MKARPAVILFDGVCLLCQRSVRTIIAHDRAGYFQFASLQGDAGRRLLAEHGLDGGQLSSVVLIEKERVYTRSSAVVAILRKLDFPLRILAGPLWLIPRIFRDALYERIASHRYQWFGRGEQCMLPAGPMAGRFLDIAPPTVTID